MVVLRSICGKTFEANKVDEELADYPEYVCSRFCPEKSCSRYMEYFYNATHHNYPR